MAENTAVEAAATMASTATKVTYGASGTSAIAWAMQVDWAFWVSIMVAITTLAINAYYKRKENKRAEELHKIMLKKAKDECNAKQD